MDKAIIARAICEKYGIEWDETQSVSHVGREVVVPGMISAAFGQNRLNAFDYSIEIPPLDKAALSKLASSAYNMRSAVVLVA